MERRAHTPAGVAEMFTVSEATIRRRIADGTIRTIRLGRRVLVPGTELDRLAEAAR
jgi:excisionase family DNA binding protein